MNINEKKAAVDNFITEGFLRNQDLKEQLERVPEIFQELSDLRSALSMYIPGPRKPDQIGQPFGQFVKSRGDAMLDEIFWPEDTRLPLKVVQWANAHSTELIDGSSRMCEAWIFMQQHEHHITWVETIIRLGRILSPEHRKLLENLNEYAVAQLIGDAAVREISEDEFYYGFIELKPFPAVITELVGLILFNYLCGTMEDPQEPPTKS